MTKHSETHMFPSADFKEIYIKVTRETLYRRDQKGLYTTGRKEVVGVDLPYDEPKNADVVVQNDGAESPEEIVDRLEKVSDGIAG